MNAGTLISAQARAFLFTAAAVSCCFGFTISGRILDPDMILFVNMADEGTAPRGFDPISCRVIRVAAHDEGGKVAEAVPDSAGSYRLSVDRPVTMLTVESGGGGAYYALEGEWAGDAAADILVDRRKIFALSGTVRNMDGSACRYEMVSAYDAAGIKLAYGYTRSTGRYEIYSNREIALLRSSADRQEVSARGPWTTDRVVDLRLGSSAEAAATGVFTVRGRAVDSDGKPLPRFRILARDRNGKNITAVLTDAKGNFSITTDKTVESLHGYRYTQEAVVSGPWSATAEGVELVVSNKGVFTIRGRVTFRNGKPAYRSLLLFVGRNGSLGSEKTDKNGRYSRTFSEPVLEVHACSPNENRSVEKKNGWNSYVKLDFVLP
ncbi:MAG: carboxypeptidase regulatory-like domain-containing protein [Chitinispirillaceae bacterium]|nr:carboxypeptidase regulatory-like domain-containing protein [Chitinispirillaceae bacterium]